MGKFLDDIWIGDESEAAEILKSAGEEDLFEKGRPRKHQVGDTHPFNANLIWTDLGNGVYAWRSRKYYERGKYNPKKDPGFKNIDRRAKRKFFRPLMMGNVGIEPQIVIKKKTKEEKK